MTDEVSNVFWDEPELVSEEPVEEESEPVTKPKYKVKVDQEEIEVDEDELLKGYSRQADYTKKAQALAEERKAIEAQRLEIDGLRAKSVEDSEEEMFEKAQLAKVKGILKQDIDWNTWFQQDQAQAQQAWAEWQQYQALEKQLASSLQSREQERKSIQEQLQTKELQDAVTKVYEEVPDFDTIKDKLATTGLSLGFTNKELNAITDVRMVKALKDAMLWQEYQKNKANKKQADSPEVTKSKQSIVGSTSKVDAALSKLF